MDGKVRVIHADEPSARLSSSHTAHTFEPVDTGSNTLVRPTQSRRDRLIAATVEAVADGSVDRLSRSLDTAKAL